ncbi:MULTISPECIES: hypothetical protein [Halomicrobium]|uniref:Uncharacterized protein n=2 Tax=Halomicrobium mukohataei TaxID=57705 RepID=C7P032_HALMD|nr:MULTISPECIES: hypothetical protein [Halomicrobium]ACV46940.1 hypothetical protein Hmuk_0809 [Halomicrobium mukohataei DSM 12286]QCD65435.1 hypothetical protein E5139_07210 [Halomicrobium mukohataei]QFR20241.1 hypothetical protein GBQ70_07205 [Halomicrobium sp. ZPS1]
MRDTFHIDSYVILSAVFGIANVAFLLFARWQIDPLELADLGLFTPIVRLGHFALGAVPAYLLVRYRIVLPVVISGFLTWAAYVDRGGMESFIALYSLPILHGHVLAVLAAFGLGEYFIRDKIPFLSHDPIL